MLHLAALNRIPHLAPQDSSKFRVMCQQNKNFMNLSDIGKRRIAFCKYFLTETFTKAEIAIYRKIIHLFRYSIDGRKCSHFLANYN